MDKLKLLSEIANQFNKENITWNLGASCMLYLRGVVESFDDIDLMVKTSDIDKVKNIMSKYTTPDIKKPTYKYKTVHFLEYKIEGIDVDIMADFIIVKDDIDYFFPLTEEEPYDIYKLNNIDIRLSNIDIWLKYYTLMERTDKVKIINEYLSE